MIVNDFFIFGGPKENYVGCFIIFEIVFCLSIYLLIIIIFRYMERLDKLIAHHYQNGAGKRLKIYRYDRTCGGV